MKRRDFITSTLAAGAMASATTQTLAGMKVTSNSPFFAFSPNVTDNDNILIIIQLFGGNDGLNTIIPAENPKYYQIRESIAVKKEQAKQWLSTDLYFHPAMADKSNYRNGFLGLMDEGRLAVIQDVGYENPNLSHFRSTDIWLSGINSSDPQVRLSDGLIGRYFAKTLVDYPAVLPPHPLCVQIGGTLSLMFQSEKGDMGIALTDPAKFFELGQGLNPDEEELKEATAYANEFNFIRNVARQSDSYSNIVNDAFKNGKNTVPYEKTSLSTQLALIAKLISGGLKSKVFMCSIGGFDTHVEQQTFDDPMNGIHPSLLRQIANGITYFMRDALQQGFADRVVGLTVSEFGRRPFENGSRGTDHGAASVQFVFGEGASIRSSRYGDAPAIDKLDANQDLIYQNDYRRVYADVLENWFGATHDEAKEILGEDILPLGVIKKRVTSVSPIENDEQGVNCYPNPTSGRGFVQFTMQQFGNVEISIFNTRGQFIQKVHSGFLSPGNHTLPYTLNEQGAYILSFRTNEHQFMKPLSVLQ